MRESFKLTVSDWPVALLLAALLVLTFFVMPHVSSVVSGLFGTVITVAALLSLINALRATRRSSPDGRSFVVYYGKLALLGLVLVASFLLLLYIITRIYTQ